MKALVKRHAKEGIWLEDMPEPEVGNNDVLVKIRRDAIDINAVNRLCAAHELNGLYLQTFFVFIIDFECLGGRTYCRENSIENQRVC